MLTFAQYAVTFLVGIATAVLSQIIVDFYRGKNRAIEKAVPKEDFSELKKKHDALEREVQYLRRWKAAVTGETNGDH
jgi:hypothetical protein